MEMPTSRRARRISLLAPRTGLQPAAKKNGSQITDKIAGTDQAHLRITQVQRRTHGRQQHTDGEPSQAYSGENA